jgi:hypothetical protein
MKDNSSRKNIANRLTLSWHVSNIYYLRCHETRCTASHEQVLFLLSISSKSKIANSQIIRVLFTEHYVIGFEIPMYNSIFSQMAKTSQNVLNYCYNLVILQIFCIFKKLVKLSSLQILKDNINRVLCLIDPLQLHYVRMIHPSHYFDLIL